MEPSQPCRFGLAESLLAEAAGVTQYDLHHDVEAMIRAADAAAPIAARLGAPPPVPHLAGLGYVHASTLGAPVTFKPDCLEPEIRPCIRRPEDIDDLREPEDYLVAGVVPFRLRLAEELCRRRPDASGHIGHDFEGPVTTAVLLMGPDFLMLPYDDPARAHRLMDFCTRSILDYTRAIRARQGRAFGGRAEGNPDDFAGMFPPEMFRKFVVPYWRKLYEGLGASERGLHSELLREEHLPFLEELRIDTFDPSVDPYLPPETLARSCRVPYGLRLWPATVRQTSAEELLAMYRRYASFHPQYIMFSLDRLADEPKVARLLDLARELEAGPA